MKIDYEEIKEIMSVFLKKPEPFITIKDLNFFDIGGEEEKKLIFHLLLLIEDGLISDLQLKTGDPEYIGIRFLSSGKALCGEIPIRLTIDGHNFAKALNEKPILERIKKDLTNAPFGFVKEVSKKWLIKQLATKLDLN
ncbi:DUF2513 domain-containing protein [Serratia symbiotica]|uniref:DUF2513 domain-containing protein n=1 Tax=Serratia symbiotica TaxID=138074 RepID=UPI0013602B74|nr:DUF2513 domain-containing protein [Serratia symbiotica]MBQ0956947.1 DUF2513 domain-containing protein [Serratia symbiotica]